MNVLISGGSKNGKTSFAQNIAVKISNGGKKFYVATMVPYDDEDRVRIANHISDRAGMGLETLEISTDISRCINDGRKGTFLIDSVTALLVNEMFSGSHDGKADKNAVSRCIVGLLSVADKTENAVFVTDYIFSDAIRYDRFTESYRESLAAINCALAKACDTVIELCAGNVIYHKGGCEL